VKKEQIMTASIVIGIDGASFDDEFMLEDAINVYLEKAVSLGFSPEEAAETLAWVIIEATDRLAQVREARTANSADSCLLKEAIESSEGTFPIEELLAERQQVERRNKPCQ